MSSQSLAIADNEELAREDVPQLGGAEVKHRVTQILRKYNMDPSLLDVVTTDGKSHLTMNIREDRNYNMYEAMKREGYVSA